MKDELAKTIKSIKEGEKEEFEKIIDKLNPIITKYVRAIYDGDKEDIREEYILALWEAVNKIQYVNSDGECLKYLHTSIKLSLIHISSKHIYNFENVVFPARLCISVLDNKILYYDNTMQKIYSIDTENGIAKLVSNL